MRAAESLARLGPDANGGGSRLKQNAGDQLGAHWRTFAKPPEIAAFRFRVAHAIRPEGAAGAGPQVRAHAAAPVGRIRECVCVAPLELAAPRAGLLRTSRQRDGVWPPALELAEVGVATL
jgi:hypothetical protein